MSESCVCEICTRFHQDSDLDTAIDQHVDHILTFLQSVGDEALNDEQQAFRDLFTQFSAAFKRYELLETGRKLAELLQVQLSDNTTLDPDTTDTRRCTRCDDLTRECDGHWPCEQCALDDCHAELCYFEDDTTTQVLSSRVTSLISTTKHQVSDTAARCQTLWMGSSSANAVLSDAELWVLHDCIFHTTKLLMASSASFLILQSLIECQQDTITGNLNLSSRDILDLSQGGLPTSIVEFFFRRVLKEQTGTALLRIGDNEILELEDVRHIVVLVPIWLAAPNSYLIEPTYQYPGTGREATLVINYTTQRIVVLSLENTDRLDVHDFCAYDQPPLDQTLVNSILTSALRGQNGPSYWVDPSWHNNVHIKASDRGRQRDTRLVPDLREDARLTACRPVFAAYGFLTESCGLESDANYNRPASPATFALYLVRELFLVMRESSISINLQRTDTWYALIGNAPAYGFSIGGYDISNAQSTSEERITREMTNTFYRQGLVYPRREGQEVVVLQSTARRTRQIVDAVLKSRDRWTSIPQIKCLAKLEVDYGCFKVLPHHFAFTNRRKYETLVRGGVTMVRLNPSDHGLTIQPPPMHRATLKAVWLQDQQFLSHQPKAVIPPRAMPRPDRPELPTAQVLIDFRRWSKFSAGGTVWAGCSLPTLKFATGMASSISTTKVFMESKAPGEKPLLWHDVEDLDFLHELPASKEDIYLYHLLYVASSASHSEANPRGDDIPFAAAMLFSTIITAITTFAGSLLVETHNLDFHIIAYGFDTTPTYPTFFSDLESCIEDLDFLDALTSSDVEFQPEIHVHLAHSTSFEQFGVFAIEDGGIFWEHTTSKVMSAAASWLYAQHSSLLSHLAFQIARGIQPSLPAIYILPTNINEHAVILLACMSIFQRRRDSARNTSNAAGRSAGTISIDDNKALSALHGWNIERRVKDQQLWVSAEHITERISQLVVGELWDIAEQPIE